MINFLEHYKLNVFKTMLFPRCSNVFDEEVAKKVENTKRYDPIIRRGGNRAARFASNNRGDPRRNEEYKR